MTEFYQTCNVCKFAFWVQLAFRKLTSTFSELQIGAQFSPIQGPPALTNVAWPQALNACFFAKGIDAPSLYWLKRVPEGLVSSDSIILPLLWRLMTCCIVPHLNSAFIKTVYNCHTQNIPACISYANVLCFVLFCCGLVIFHHILQGYFTGTGAIMWLPQCLWSNPEG